jgi:metallo-beta-lactamase class B
MKNAFAAALVAACLAVSLSGQEDLLTPEAHVARAKAAAKTDLTGVFDVTCGALSRTPADRGAGGGAQATLARDNWHAEPVKVFDNLYFVGQTEFSAWAVTTCDGIILIDTIFDYSVEDEVVGGLRKLGLDPSKIKYAIVSHGHGDHSAGAKYLQDRFKARVMLSATDWDLVDRGRGAKPARDLVARDGQKLTLGDTTITIYVTPGHTAGTLSYLIPVKDNGQAHLVAEWGGTAFNFPRTQENFRTYAASAERFGEIAVNAGADVIISNHSTYDGSTRKLPVLAARKPGDRHPYVIGTDAVKRYMQVAAECAKAWVARL